jgi:hypothetical protein
MLISPITRTRTRYFRYVYHPTLDSIYDLYRVSQEERSIFWQVKVSVILIKEYIYIFRNANGFRDGAISLYSTLFRQKTLHILTRVAKGIDVDGGICENVYTR